MAYKDFANGVALPESDLDELSKQTVMKYATLAARTADAALGAVLREGMTFYLDDLNVLRIQRTTTDGQDSTIGPVHGVLTSWTPTVTQTAVLTPGISYARYQRIGRNIIGWFSVTIGSGAGTGGSAVVIGGLPATAATTGLIVGSAQLFDASVPSAYVASLYLASTTTFDLRVTAATGNNQLGVTGFTAGLANTPDTIAGCFTYEAAADG